MRTFLLCFCVLVSATVFAQAPVIQWAKSIGGPDLDMAKAVEVTPDSGYIIAGYTGGYDGMVVKLNASGSIEWSKTYGGAGYDFFYAVSPAKDGGYIMAGGTVTPNTGVTADLWVVKINASGAIQWQKKYGGYYADFANSIKQTPDGGYIVAGVSSSPDGDVGVNNGLTDGWILKLNSTGAIEWKKVLGTQNNDEITDIKPVNGGYICTGLYNNNQAYIVKLDTDGEVKWQRTYGSNGFQEFYSIDKTNDGNYILGGVSYYANKDGWFMKVDTVGNGLWQKTIGGAGDDVISKIRPLSNGDYIAAGSTTSKDGSFSGNHGQNDYWVFKVNPSGNIIVWQKLMGGSGPLPLPKGEDVANDIVPTRDSGYLVVGYSFSANGDITDHHGGTDQADMWVVKLAPDTARASQYIVFSPIPSKTITSADFTLSATASSELPVTFTSRDTTVAIIINGNVVHIKKEGTTNITAIQAGNQDFGPAISVTNLLTVTKNPQTINFDGIPEVFVGTADFALKATASSGLPITYTSSDTNIAIIVSGNKIHIKKYGTTNITAAQAGDNTYAAAVSVTRLLNIYKGYQTITFAHLSPRFMGTPDFALTATASSGLPVSYTSSDTTVATIINGNTIHILKAGTTIITATQAGNDIYLAATAVTSAFVVNKVSQIITFTNFTDKTYGSPDFDLGAFTSSHLPVGYTIADTNVISLVAGKAHIKKAGITNVTALQAGNDTFATATPVTIQLTIYKSAQTITFTAPGAHNILEGIIGLTATASSGMAVTYTSSDTSIASVAGNSVILKKAGTVSITALQAGDNNYTAASQPRQLVISGFRISTYYQYICTGTPLTFTVNAPNAPAGITYQWQKNGNNVGDNSPQYIDSTLQNNTLIQCIATFNGRSYTSNAFNIGVITPVVTVTGPGVVCQASAATYNVKVNNNLGGGILGYQWKKNNINVGYNQNYYIDEHINANDSIWCTIITDAACKASEALTSNKIVVNVLPLGTVAATVTYQPFNYKLCAPGDTTSIVFHAVGQYGGANPSFQWMMNNQAIGTGSSYYTGHGLKAGDKIYCRYTSTQKCVTDNVHVVQSNTVTLSAKTPLTPAITIAQNPTGPVCHGDSVRFKVSSIYGSGSAPVYQWMKNNIKVGTNSDVYYDNDLLIGDSVWCTMKTDYPCAVSPIVASNKIKPVVNYTTPLIPSAINGPATVRANQKDVGYLVNRVNDVTYLWSVPAGATIRSGLHINEALINWGTTGGTLVVQARNGCGYSERSRLIVTVTPGLQSLDGFEEASTISGIASGKARLYPNPATTNTTVSFTATEAGKYMVQVVDANGRILQVKETNAIKGRNTININVSGYAKGSYFVRLTNKDGRQQATFTLVVAK